ncbi:integrase [Bradyrhizobium huanghuaihaiense]
MATTSSSPLRRRMIEDMTLRNLSPSTQQSYVYAVANFSRHFGRSPDKLNLEQVRAYQLHLIGLKRSWTHINQVTCALRFFYAVTLGRKEAIENIISAREPIKQPLVLSAEEVARFLEAVPALRDRVALVTAYAAGLRVGEVSRLKPSAIDSKRNPDHRRQGRQGPLRNAVAAAVQHPAILLVSGQTAPLAVSGAQSGRSGECRHVARGLPQSSATCRSR